MLDRVTLVLIVNTAVLNNALYHAALETLRALKALGLNVVLSDSSPLHSGVSKSLEAAGAVVVRSEEGGKSAAARLALGEAAKRFPEAQVGIALIVKMSYNENK